MPDRLGDSAASMTRVKRILERLRPEGAGTAAPPGVPADRVAELVAELEPVLARLDEVRPASTSSGR